MQSSNGHRPTSQLKTIAGVPIGEYVEPASAQAVADSLLEAASAELAVIPVGGGTHLGVGNPPHRASLALSTRQLNRVIAYEPADMTLSVEAGASLASVQSTLAEHGQGLPVEVSDPEHATIGGILASAIYGPKRLGWGTLRDYLIGIAVAYPDGTVAKAGGLVVKNVSGFDLMRMHHGALGTLGVIVSANFKVLPAPRSERTLVVDDVDPASLGKLLDGTMRWRGKAVAIQIDVRDGKSSVAIRLDGRERTTALLGAELAERLAWPTRGLDSEESRAFWADYGARFDASNDPASWWIRCRSRPSETLPLLSRVRHLLPSTASEISVSPGLGYVDVIGKGSVGAVRQTLESMRSICPTTSVVSLPESDRAGVNVWSGQIDAIELMHALKREYDPDGVLNPGRFVGGM